MRFIGPIFLSRIFFWVYAAVILLFVTAYVFPWMRLLAFTALFVLIGLTIIDALLLFLHKEPLRFERKITARMNLGDQNEVTLMVTNDLRQPVFVKLYESFPREIADRSVMFAGLISANQVMNHSYSFCPKERGNHHFGKAYLMMSSLLGLTERRIIFQAEHRVEVYPSVLQMRKYELLVFQQQKLSSGIKKIRRLGNTNEFEQIKSYVQGDDIKRINWKATSRKNELMTNQYQEEKSQHIVCIIDKSRSMQNRFEDMTLLDYAINSALVFSNIALRKGDKAGLLTFADKIGSQLLADRKAGQLRRIMKELYNQKTHFLESNYELLFQTIRRTVKTRSLLVLFTQFETEFAMRRNLPMLRRLNQQHLLLVVFFENTVLKEMANNPVATSEELFQSVVAERMSTIQHRIALELNRNGIQTVLTTPAELSIKTINKYIELKAKGAI